jgi:hypothetical protein
MTKLALTLEIVGVTPISTSSISIAGYSRYYDGYPSSYLISSSS